MNRLAGIGIGLERKQTIGDHLQMLFRLRDKKFQDLLWNLRIGSEVGNNDWRCSAVRGRGPCRGLPGTFRGQELRGLRSYLSFDFARKLLLGFSFSGLLK